MPIVKLKIISEQKANEMSSFAAQNETQSYFNINIGRQEF